MPVIHSKKATGIKQEWHASFIVFSKNGGHKITCMNHDILKGVYIVIIVIAFGLFECYIHDFSL